MDPVKNPYVPGAGRVPAALVGRDETLRHWSVALQRAEQGITDQPFVLYGLRGVGKTVLLTKLRHDAEERDWWAVQIEAGGGNGLRRMIGEGLYGPLVDANRPNVGRRFLKALKTAVSFKASYDQSGAWTFGVDLSDAAGGGADSGVLDTDLRKIIKDVALAAREEQVGLAILIDEAQDLDRQELMTLAAVAQSAAQDNWPVLFALAGLPSLPQTLAEAKSYSERFEFTSVEKLSLEDARAAVARPAERAGVEWSHDALDEVVTMAGRYPYFLQQFGRETWDEASENPISLTAAKIGVARGQNQLDTGFFRARWDRTTAAEKDYLRAMCPEGDEGVGSGEVAKRLGKRVQSLGPARANLISKGLVYAPDHGVVTFTVPGMADFIGRQTT